MKKMIEEISACREKYESMPVREDAKEVTREEFTLLLSGISACRKVPEKIRQAGRRLDRRVRRILAKKDFLII